MPTNTARALHTMLHKLATFNVAFPLRPCNVPPGPRTGKYADSGLRADVLLVRDETGSRGGISLFPR